MGKEILENSLDINIASQRADIVYTCFKIANKEKYFFHVHQSHYSMQQSTAFRTKRFILAKAESGSAAFIGSDTFSFSATV